MNGVRSVQWLLHTLKVRKRVTCHSNLYQRNFVDTVVEGRILDKLIRPSSKPYLERYWEPARIILAVLNFWSRCEFYFAVTSVEQYLFPDINCTMDCIGMDLQQSLHCVWMILYIVKTFHSLEGERCFREQCGTALILYLNNLLVLHVFLAITFLVIKVWGAESCKIFFILWVPCRGHGFLLVFCLFVFSLS